MGDAPDDADVAALDAQFSLTELDRKVLSQTDDEFVAHDWEDLKRTIGASMLKILKCTEPPTLIFHESSYPWANTHGRRE